MCQDRVQKEESKGFDANEFVQYLKREGTKVRCDSSNEFFRKMEMPSFYDETKFKRGQKFFHDHIFAMFYGKLLGLISDLALPDGQAILRFTGQSSEPETAFRRYVSTILHMCTWYSSDLEPNSRLWKSLIRIRSYHNAASKVCSKSGVGYITQYQMGMAQFGFMGYILVRSRAIGLHIYTEEDFEGFVHFWRVVGHVLGIEERFNICRSSLRDSRLVCEEIINQIFKSAILKWDSGFLSMAEAMTRGLWCMMPVLNKNVCLRHVYDMVTEDDSQKAAHPPGVKLNHVERFTYCFVCFMLYLLRFKLIRTIQKYNMYLILYLTEKFPFLAYYKFRKVDFQIRQYREQRTVNYIN